MEIEKIADLRPDPENARTISDDELDGLRVSLDRFGDISGIVFNVRTGTLVAGHQRLSALKAEYGDGLSIRSGPGERAAVVTPGGAWFKIRLVDWDPDFALAANIAANSSAIAGAFTESLHSQLDRLASGALDEDGLFDRLRLGELRAELPAIEPIELGSGEDPGDPGEPGDLVKCPKCGFKFDPEGV